MRQPPVFTLYALPIIKKEANIWFQPFCICLYHLYQLFCKASSEPVERSPCNNSNDMRDKHVILVVTKFFLLSESRRCTAMGPSSMEPQFFCFVFVFKFEVPFVITTYIDNCSIVDRLTLAPMVQWFFNFILTQVQILAYMQCVCIQHMCVCVQ